MDFSVAYKIRVKNGVLQRFMDERGWSQTDLAKAIGVAPELVCGWINMLHYPSRKYRGDLSDVVGLPFKKIFPEFLVAHKVRHSKKEITTYETIEIKVLGENSLRQLSYDPDYAQTVYEKDMNKALYKVLDTLPRNEETVLRGRFGIGCDVKTLDKLGLELNVTKERIRQIEKKAIMRLRKKTCFKDL